MITKIIKLIQYELLSNGYTIDEAIIFINNKVMRGLSYNEILNQARLESKVR